MGGYLFLYSLVYFSDDSRIHIDDALRPPKPASESAKTLSPKIIEDTPKKETVEISNNFNSFIPAELSYEKNEGGLILKISVKHENLDWILKNGELAAELYIKIAAWSGGQRYEEIHDTLSIVSTKEKIENKNSTFVFESSPIKLYQQPTKLSVYIKNNGKYNAWFEEIAIK